MVQTYVVVGTGATGLSAMYTLCKHLNDDSRIIVIESADRVGGHAWTVPCGDEHIDVGFMVMNLVTYPNILQLFSELNVEIEKSDMSFAISNQNNSWSFQSLDKNWMRNNIIKPRFWNFLKAHQVFCKKAREYLANADQHSESTVGQFCEGLDEDFSVNFLQPFVSAVWSVGMNSTKDFSILPLLRFMDNHRFLGLETLEWYTPAKRSKDYVSRILDYCGSKVDIRLNTRVTEIFPESKEIVITNSKNNNSERIHYDKIIFACSAPAQAALNVPAKSWLQRFSVSRSRVIAHRHADLGMPLNRDDWSSWNVRSDEIKPESITAADSDSHGAAVTYWISRIQNLRDRSVFVTVNPSKIPKKKRSNTVVTNNCNDSDLEDDVLFDAIMEHPVMDIPSFKAQEEEFMHQGKCGIFHAGAWLRHGFHEDAVFTGIHAARRALDRQDIAVMYPTGSPGVREKQAVKGYTTHTRKLPTLRCFTYPVYYYRWDLRFPPKEFARVDFFGDENVPLDTCVRRELQKRLGIWPMGKIEVVANLRFLSFVFNPIIPYFAHDEAGNLVALLCEVHNTPWKERTLYAMKVLPDGQLSPNIQAKVMHVSPFNPPPSVNGNAENVDEPTSQWTYKFDLKGEHWLEVDARRDGVSVIVATVQLESDPIHANHQIPFGSWSSLYWVYVQALSMALEKFPYYNYQTKERSFTDGYVLTWLTWLFPVYLAWKFGYYLTSGILLLTTGSFIGYALSGGANIGYLYLAWLLVGISVLIAYWRHSLDLGRGAMATMIALASSMYAHSPQTKAQDMIVQTMNRLNYAVALLSLVVSKISMSVLFVLALVNAILAIPFVLPAVAGVF